MSRARYHLYITLKSDLCAASGDGFSSGVDIDVCHDEYGLPLIPARRLKGCLREAAELVFPKGSERYGEISALFGTPGSREPGSIVVKDALLEGYAQERNVARMSGYGPERVLGAYTRTLAQTAIEGDSVKGGSLRFARVVNRWAPGCKDKELVFVAPIEADERFEDMLIDASCALRNIGYRRNRGLGAVRCRLEATEATTEDVRYSTLMRNGKKRISYAVRTDSALMLPTQSANESAPFIPGSSVLGFFAGQMRDAEDFDEIFLADKVVFSPLYPTDALGNRCLPASALLAKVKGGPRNGEVVNLKTASLAEDEQPKPLKDGFVGSDFYPVQPKTEIVYHHATQKADQKATLYTQQCVSANQVFSGYIEGPEHLVDQIEACLRKDRLAFGRSKSAQYARCALVPHTEPVGFSTVELVEGKEYVAILDTDALLCVDGTYRADYDSLKTALAERLGGCLVSTDAEDGRGPTCTSVRTRTLAGYNSKWNHKKPHVRALGAGSCIVFTSARTLRVDDEIYIGERNGEGLGRVVILDVSSIRPERAAAVAKDAGSVPDTPLARAIAQAEALDAAKVRTVAFTKEHRDELSSSFSSSFVGRLTLMAKEAASAQDLDERIDSVKTATTRERAKSIVGKLRGAIGGLSWQDEQECIVLMLTCAKYFIKQAPSKEVRNG